MTTKTNAELIEQLKQKYDAAAIANGMRLRPDDFLDELEWRDRIDQHYARSWLMFTYGGLFTRKGLDDRTRLLVSIAQFLAMGELEEFERQIPSALAAGASPREVLEIILQSTVYIGYGGHLSRDERACANGKSYPRRAAVGRQRTRSAGGHRQFHGVCRHADDSTDGARAGSSR